MLILRQKLRANLAYSNAYLSCKITVTVSPREKDIILQNTEKRSPKMITSKLTVLGHYNIAKYINV